MTLRLWWTVKVVDADRGNMPVMIHPEGRDVIGFGVTPFEALETLRRLVEDDYLPRVELVREVLRP